ncbi:MAG: SPFH domain-containing protein [Bacteroidales bacterium]|nr:SPFH domain-containing protein [Bacteroidales bacterium]
MESKEIAKKMTVVNNGFLHLLINIALLVAALYLCIGAGENNFTLGGIIGGLCWLLWGLHIVGFKTMVIQPNHARVLTFFGKYVGTVRDNGFFWTNPFYVRKKMSLRADNMDVEPIKVNDRNGNPIMIGLVLVWKVEDTYRACFDVEATSYNSFVAVQSDSALRKVASLYAYDNLEDVNEVTLRNGGDEINRRLEQEIRKHLEIAGIEVVEARINYLAYAQEIASVMLKRQQAEAIIAAREKIVEGAVSMVDMALKKLAAENVVEMDDERKAAMVSNLMVVLCGDEGASPVINTGSIY